MSDDAQEAQDNNTPAQDANDDNQTFPADYVKGLRKESAGYRTQVRDLEAKLAQFEKAQSQAEEERLAKQNEWQQLAEKRQTEIEALKTAHAEQAKQIQQQRIKAAFISEAAGKVVDIEAAYQLANLSSVEVDESGSINGVTEVVTALLEAKPYLVANGKIPAPSLDGGAGGGQRPGGKPLSDEEMAIAKRMGIKPEDYQKFKK